MAYYGVRYAPGAVVRPLPGCGPPCVFADRAAAERFARDMNALHRIDLRVVPCAWVPSAHKEVWRHDKQVEYVEYVYDIRDLPPGTALAQAVFCFE